MWFVTSEQTAGRGRRQRPWIAPRGNLAASVLELLDIAPAVAATIGFVAGLAEAKALDAVSREACLRLGEGAPRYALKWPNDVLANIFEEDTTPAPVETLVASAANEVSFEGLDGPHTELVELLELKGSIARAEFDQRARAMKLLADGAIERINDWSFDRFEEPLLEDGDEIVMVPHLRERLAELRETTA